MLQLNRLLGVCMMVLACLSTGCSLCCSPNLEDYGAFGSRTPRVDMKNGRVGSVFSDPELMGTSIDHQTVNADEEIFVSESLSTPDLDQLQLIGYKAD
jgi:hypothetical protein